MDGLKNFSFETFHKSVPVVLQHLENRYKRLCSNNFPAMGATRSTDVARELQSRWNPNESTLTFSCGFPNRDIVLILNPDNDNECELRTPGSRLVSATGEQWTHDYNDHVIAANDYIKERMPRQILYMDTCIRCANIADLVAYPQFMFAGPAMYKCCARKLIMLYLCNVLDHAPQSLIRAVTTLTAFKAPSVSKKSFDVVLSKLYMAPELKYHIRKFVDVPVPELLNCFKWHTHNQECIENARTFGQPIVKYRKKSIARSNSGSEYFWSDDNDHKKNDFFYYISVDDSPAYTCGVEFDSHRLNKLGWFGKELHSVEDAKEHILYLKESLTELEYDLMVNSMKVEANLAKEAAKKAEIYAIEKQLRSMCLTQESDKEDRREKRKRDAVKEAAKRIKTQEDLSPRARRHKRIHYRTIMVRNAYGQIEAQVERLEQQADFENSGVFEMIKQAFSDVFTKFTDFGKGIAGIFKFICNVPRLTSHIEQLIEKFKDITGSIIKETQRVFKAVLPVLLMQLAFAMYRKPSKFTLLLYFLQLFERAYPAQLKNLFYKVAEYICNMGSSTDSAPTIEGSRIQRLEQQSGKDDTSLLATLVSVYTQAISGFTMPIKLAYALVDSSTKEVKRLKSQVSETWKALDWLKNVFKGTYEWFFQMRLNEVHTPNDVKLGDFLANVNQIHLWNAKELAQTENQALVRNTAKMAALIQDCIFRKKLEHLGVSALRVLEGSITRLQRFLAVHSRNILEFIPAFTIPAFWVYYCGPAGTGKSSIISPTSKILLRNSPYSDKIYDKENHIYMHNPTTAFDNKYCGQFTWGVDDIFQVKEKTGMQKADSDALKMVHLIGPTPTEIDHSISEMKGGVFDSPTVVTTSNVYYPDSELIVSKKALHRRRAMVVEVTRLPGPFSLDNMRFSILPTAVKKSKDGKGFAVCFDDGTNDEAWTDNMFAAAGVDVATVARSLVKREFLDLTFKEFSKKLVLEFHRKAKSGYAAQFQDFQIDDYVIDPEELDAELSRSMALHPVSELTSMYHHTEVVSALQRRPVTQQLVDEDLFEDASDRMQQHSGSDDEQETQSVINQVGINATDDERSFHTKLLSWLGFESVLPRSALTRPDDNGERLSRFDDIFAFVYGKRSIFLFLFIIVLAFIAILGIIAFFNRHAEESSDFTEDELRKVANTLPEDIRERFLDATLRQESTYGSDKAKKASIVRAKVKSIVRPAVNLVKMEQQGNSINTIPAISKNLLKVKIDETGNIATGLAICGKWVLVPDHLLYGIKSEELKVRITHPNQADTYYYSFMSKRIISNFDFTILYIERMNDYPDIRHIIAPESQVGKVEGGLCLGVRRLGNQIVTSEMRATRIEHYEVLEREGFYHGQKLSEENYWKQLQAKYGQDIPSREGIYMLSEYGNGDVQLVADWIETTHVDVHPFMKGDCGSVLVAAETGFITGIYQGKCKGSLRWVPIHRDIFKDLRVDFVRKEPSIDHMEVHCLADGEIGHSVIKDQAFINYIPRQTNLIPTVLHGIVDVQKEPSVLSAFDKRLNEEEIGTDPLIRGFVNNFTPTHPVPESTLRVASKSVSARLNTIRPAPVLGKKLLNEDQMLNGVAGEYKGVEMGTSIGLPFKHYTREPGKYGILEMDENNQRQWRDTKAAKLVRDHISEAESLMRKRTVPVAYISEQLKDEALLKKKIKIGKTRTFECFPMHIALLVRKYCGAFIAALERQCVQQPVSVGVNVHGSDWKFLYERLSRFGGKVIAGDYAFWDKGLHGSLIKEAMELINQWYNDSEENQNVRRCLGEMFAETFVVLENKLYQVHQGMPSGVALTSVLNSLCNWLLITSCIYDTLKAANRLDLFKQEFWELALYGDDHIIALMEELQKYITFGTVKQYMTNLGVGYTDATKSDRVFDFENVTETTYLKRQFVPDGNFVRAPLEKASVENSINWCHKGQVAEQTIMVSWDSIKIESHHHGREYYDYICGKVSNAMRSYCESMGLGTPEMFYDYDNQEDLWKTDYFD